MQGFDDGIPAHGAALAFYAMLSLIPMLALLVSLIAAFYNADAASQHIQSVITRVAGAEEAEAIKSLLQATSHPEGKGLIATIVSLFILLFGASSVFTELQSVLNFIWKTPASTKGVVMLVVRERFLAFVMIFGVGIALLASIIIGTALTAAVQLASTLIPQFAGITQTLTALLGVTVAMLIFAFTFKTIPSVTIEWGDVWLGAAITALLFVAGQFLIGLYLTRSGVTAGYGPAGSMVALLIWIYYSAQIYFFGAEFTAAYAHQLGSHRGKNVKRRKQPPEAAVAAERPQRPDRPPVL